MPTPLGPDLENVAVDDLVADERQRSAFLAGVVEVIQLPHVIPTHKRDPLSSRFVDIHWNQPVGDPLRKLVALYQTPDNEEGTEYSIFILFKAIVGPLASIVPPIECLGEAKQLVLVVPGFPDHVCSELVRENQG